MPFVEPLSKSLVDHAKHLTRIRPTLPYQHFEAEARQGKTRLHKLLRERRPMTTAWMPCLCCKEHCRTTSNFCMANGGRGWRFDHGLNASSTSISSIPTSEPDVRPRASHVSFHCPNLRVNGYEWLARQHSTSQRVGIDRPGQTTLLSISTTSTRPKNSPTSSPSSTGSRSSDRFVQRNQPVTQATLARSTLLSLGESTRQSSAPICFFSRKAELAKVYPELLEHALLNLISRGRSQVSPVVACIHPFRRRSPHRPAKKIVILVLVSTTG